MTFARKNSIHRQGLRHITMGFEGRQALFMAMVRCHLNPKMFSSNIPEYVALKEFCRNSKNSGAHTFSRAFVMGRGIRGAKGILVAAEFWKKVNYNFSEVNLIRFARHFRCLWRRDGKTSALSHREGRHHLFSGWPHVKLLLRKEGRQAFLRQAEIMRVFFTTGKDCSSKNFDVHGVRKAMKGYRLSKHGRVGKYNAMEWARAAALIAEELQDVSVKYSDEIHDFMSRDQSGPWNSIVFPKRETLESMLIRIREWRDKESSWITAWIANCEFRQAEARYGSTGLWALCQKMERHGAEIVPTIRRHIDAYEASGRKCLCRQVCDLVCKYVPQAGVGVEKRLYATRQTAAAFPMEAQHNDHTEEGVSLDASAATGILSVQHISLGQKSLKRLRAGAIRMGHVLKRRSRARRQRCIFCDESSLSLTFHVMCRCPKWRDLRDQYWADRVESKPASIAAQVQQMLHTQHTHQAHEVILTWAANIDRDAMEFWAVVSQRKVHGREGEP